MRGTAMNYTKSETVLCLHCGAKVAQKEGPGRAKVYCSTWHAQLWRQRMACWL
jgi:hypothetical protein